MEYLGAYNARRDNLEGFWRPCFGHTHGAMLVDVFYENISKAKIEGKLLETQERDENIVLEFRLSNGQLMSVACLWSHWSAHGQPELISFAAIQTSRLRRSQQRAMTAALFLSGRRT